MVSAFAFVAGCLPQGADSTGKVSSSAEAPPAPPARATANQPYSLRIVRNLHPLSAYTRLIGRPAPPLDISDWLCPGDTDCKPFESFEPGSVHVVVFWASWCPRCREALPLLASIQSRFAGDGVKVIVVSHEDPEDIRQFLVEDDAHSRTASRCCIACDPDESVHRAYMEAVDETGIPTAFVVGRQGHIEWIGHPVDLEGPLTEIVANRWNREPFVAERGRIEPIRARMAAIVEEASGPRSAEAIAALRSFVAERTDDAWGLNEIGWLVVEFAEGKPLPPAFLEAATAAVERSLDSADDPNTLDTLAHLLAMQGRLDEAIATQRRAVEGDGTASHRFRPYLDELEAKRAAAP